VKKTNKWNFEKSKKFIMKNCSQPGWADDNEQPILESTIDKAISLAHEIQSYFHNHDFALERPYFCQCGDGSIDLDFTSFTHGYKVLYSYHPEEDEALYGENECRNWNNTKKSEVKRFNTLESRRVLGLFARWCKLRNIDWEIEIKQLNNYDKRL